MCNYRYHTTCPSCDLPIELTFAERRTLIHGSMIDESACRKARALAAETSRIAHHYVISMGQGPSPWCECLECYSGYGDCGCPSCQSEL